MSRDPFGWSYPPGAENDPMAPYNQHDPPPCRDCGHDSEAHAEAGPEGTGCEIAGCSCDEYQLPEDPLSLSDDETEHDRQENEEA